MVLSGTQKRHGDRYFWKKPAGPFKWKQVTLLTSTLSSNNAQIKLPSLKKHKYVSIQIRVDTSVAAGLYNDFVFIRLSLRSKTHYAVVGFEA
jgi:hypothetical protein